jgi:hypothetical protein
MSKIHRSEKKERHVLAKLREVIGCSQKSAPEDLGIPTDTCASIECGRVHKGRIRYPLTARVANRVSEWTGISSKWLLCGNPRAKMTTPDGRPFTIETFQRIKHERQLGIEPARKGGNECFRFYLLLCVKLGRVMLAATDAKDAKFAAWKLRHELNTIGRKYPAFESKDIKNGVIKNPTAPEAFDWQVQNLMNTGTKPKQLWKTILERFNHELCAIETDQAKSASKPKSEPAKPTRR